MPFDPDAHGVGSSAARPSELRRLAAVLEERDRQLRGLATDLDGAARAWGAGRPLELGDELRSLVRRSSHLIDWLARLAEGFERADGGSLATVRVPDSSLAEPVLGRAGEADARATGLAHAGLLRRLLNAHEVHAAGAWPADWESLAGAYPRIAALLRRLGAGSGDGVYAAAVLDGLGEEGVRRTLVLVEQLGAAQTRARWDRPDLAIVGADLARALLQPFATLFAAAHRSAVTRTMLPVEGEDQRRQLALLGAYGRHPPGWATAAAHTLLVATREEAPLAVTPSANGLYEGHPELRSVELAAVRLLHRDPAAALRFVTDPRRGRGNTAALLHPRSPEPSPGLERLSAEVLRAGYGARRLAADLAFEQVVAVTAEGGLSDRMRRTVAGLLATGDKVHLLAAEAADARGAEARWSAVTAGQCEDFVAELARDEHTTRLLTGQVTAYAGNQVAVALDDLRRHGRAGSASTVFASEGDRVGSLYGLLGLGLAEVGAEVERRYQLVGGSLLTVAGRALRGVVTAGRSSGPLGVAAGIGIEAAVALGRAALERASTVAAPTGDLLVAIEQDLTDAVRAVVRANPSLTELVASARISVDDVANVFARAASGAPHLVRALARS